MNCGKARESAYFYADDELSADQVPAFEAHLAECRDCQRFVDALRREAELLTDLFRTSGSVSGSGFGRPVTALSRLT